MCRVAHTRMYCSHEAIFFVFSTKQRPAPPVFVPTVHSDTYRYKGTYNISTYYTYLLFYFFLYDNHFYFPAQRLGGFTIRNLLDKPWSQVSSLLPPGTCLQCLSSSFPLIVDLDRMLLTQALALSADQFLMQEKVPTSMCTG